jgi:hypothetical protein
MVTVAVFMAVWTAAELGAAPPDFNDLFDECPGDACGAPPSGGIGGGGSAGGPLIVAYTWGPLFSVQEDVDADGYNDEIDNCMFTPNDPGLNADGDDYGDECDLCPQLAAEDNKNSDADVEIKAWQDANPGADLADMPRSLLLGDPCDPDRDGDLIDNDHPDNCPDVRNPDQQDSDNDGIGDLCDADDDNDGVPDLLDNCITDENPGQANEDFFLDGDMGGDECDHDYDNDGLDDRAPAQIVDRCPNLQSVENGDADGDGHGDPCDNCPNIRNPDQADTNGNGKGDACDV